MRQTIIDDPNHWSNRQWILVENQPEEKQVLSIWTDGESFKPVLVISEGQPPTVDERRLGVHLILLHNAEFKRRNPDVTRPKW